MKIKSPSSSTVPAVICSYVLTLPYPTVKSPFTCSKSSSDFILLIPHRLKSPSISSCPLSKDRNLPATFPLIFVLLPVITISSPTLIPPSATNPASPPVEFRLPAISTEPVVISCALNKWSWLVFMSPSNSSRPVFKYSFSPFVSPLILRLQSETVSDSKSIAPILHVLVATSSSSHDVYSLVSYSGIISSNSIDISHNTSKSACPPNSNGSSYAAPYPSSFCTHISSNIASAITYWRSIFVRCILYSFTSSLWLSPGFPNAVATWFIPMSSSSSK